MQHGSSERKATSNITSALLKGTYNMSLLAHIPVDTQKIGTGSAPWVPRLPTTQGAVAQPSAICRPSSLRCLRQPPSCEAHPVPSLRSIHDTIPLTCSRHCCGARPIELQLQTSKTTSPKTTRAPPNQETSPIRKKRDFGHHEGVTEQNIYTM